MVHSRRPRLLRVLGRGVVCVRGPTRPTDGVDVALEGRGSALPEAQQALADLQELLALAPGVVLRCQARVHDGRRLPLGVRHADGDGQVPTWMGGHDDDEIAALVALASAEGPGAGRCTVRAQGKHAAKMRRWWWYRMRRRWLLARRALLVLAYFGGLGLAAWWWASGIGGTP